MDECKPLAFGGSVKATHNGTAMEWIFDTRFAEWSNAVTETYALVDSTEAAGNKTNDTEAGVAHKHANVAAGAYTRPLLSSS
jgi:hypothetical protein